VVTILVVDDESTTRRLVSLTLKSINVDVIEAPDAKAALQLADQHQFALMLVDMGLPDMSGLDLIERLRAQPSTAQTPIVWFTAQPDADEGIRAQRLGVREYLAKPFNTQALRDLVMRYVCE